MTAHGHGSVHNGGQQTKVAYGGDTTDAVASVYGYVVFGGQADGPVGDAEYGCHLYVGGGGMWVEAQVVVEWVSMCVGLCFFSVVTLQSMWLMYLDIAHLYNGHPQHGAHYHTITPSHTFFRSSRSSRRSTTSKGCSPPVVLSRTARHRDFTTVQLSTSNGVQVSPDGVQSSRGTARGSSAASCAVRVGMVVEVS